MPARRTVVFGILGTTLDAGRTRARWQRWRPTVALCQHEALPVHRLELLHGARSTELLAQVTADIAEVAPATEVRATLVTMEDPWDFEEVYAALHDLARSYPFAPEQEDYLVHISTGTHVAQICLFLLTESRHFPARLLQGAPPKGGQPVSGSYAIIDLDLSKYDRIASRMRQAQAEGLSFLKAGIATKSAAYNRIIEQIERVAIASRAPILLTGPTGAGKSQLARRIYELKKARRQVGGELVDVNCATIRGDGAMSALFGHAKGAFTGAVGERAGLLRKAHGGVLFLDEVGELGADEQAMLLRAIEEGVFFPVGSDREARSEFLLIAGTNRDLGADVGAGRFREDLLARINLWTFKLPGLAERPEDIDPNLDFELERAAAALGVRVTFSKEARGSFLGFARSKEARWSGNFRDLNAAMTRMATLAPGGRITTEVVEEETGRLREGWKRGEGRSAAGRAGAGAGARAGEEEADLVVAALGAERAEELDRFDRVQLADVLRVCAGARNMSDAGRTLFAASRARKTSVNDADRLRKYLARFELSWEGLPRG